MALQFKDIISYIFGPKTWVDENWCAPDNHVAAGDPAHGGMASNLPDDFPKIFTIGESSINVDSFTPFVVDGPSMSPEDISNGMVLLCQPINADAQANIEAGKYLIIKIDPKYYVNKNKKVNFKHKLRRSLANVPNDPDKNQLLTDLKSTEDSLLIKKNQEAFKKKFDETYSYYDQTEPMMLSVTYRDGELRYSFHPKRLVEYVAEYAVSKQGDKYQIRKV